MHLGWNVTHMVVPALLAVNGGALAQSTKPAAPSAKTAAAAPGELTTEQAWVLIADLPTDRLVVARKMISSGETPTQAALMIREAAALMTLEATRAEGPDKSELTQSAADLWALASKVETGEAQDITVVDRSFASAEYALASHHRNQAKRHFMRKELDSARSELASAARHVGRGAEWAGKETLTGVRQVVGETLVIAGDATRVVGMVPEEIGKGIDAVGRGIDRLGRDVKGERRPTRGVETPQPTQNP